MPLTGCDGAFGCWTARLPSSFPRWGRRSPAWSSWQRAALECRWITYRQEGGMTTAAALGLGPTQTRSSPRLVAPLPMWSPHCSVPSHLPLSRPRTPRCLRPPQPRVVQSCCSRWRVRQAPLPLRLSITWPPRSPMPRLRPSAMCGQKKRLAMMMVPPPGWVDRSRVVSGPQGPGKPPL